MIRAQTAVLSHFRLDGGAMFGSVPKALWERFEAADDKNRIALVSRVLYLEGDGRRILVDAGMGTKFGSRESEMFQIQPVPETAVPFRWSELTHFIPTHLHFDHAGGMTARREAGAPAELVAPQAKVYLQRANWERALEPGPRERASYIAENVEPLRKADLVLLDGDTEALPGIAVHRSDGHTRGLQWLTVEATVGTLAFPADLIPTTSHLHLPYVMGYDMCVETLLGEKEAFLRRAVKEDWIVVFAHDVKTPAARLSVDVRGRYGIMEPVLV